MKTDNQPQHTQGRYWLRESPNSIWVEIMADETHIATIPYKTKEQQANAHWIVKAVNMHDELVSGLRKALEVFAISDKKEGQEKAFLELSALLKQSEGK